MAVFRFLYDSRNISALNGRNIPIALQSRKQTLLRITHLHATLHGLTDGAVFCSLYLTGAIGSLVSHQTAAECISGNRAEYIVCTEPIHTSICCKIHDIGTDAAADIIMSLNAARLDRQLLLQKLCGCVQSESASGTVAIGVDTSADQGVMHIQASVYIVKSGNSSDIISSDHNTGNGFDRDRLAFCRERDLTVIVSGDAARIVTSGIPGINNHIENGTVIIRKITCTVVDHAVFFVVANDSAHVAVIAGCHAVVDAVFQGYILFVLSDNSADIRLSDDITAVCRDCHHAVCTDRLRNISAQCSGDPAHVVGTEHVTVFFRRRVVDQCAVAVTDDPAHIFSF